MSTGVCADIKRVAWSFSIGARSYNPVALHSMPISILTGSTHLHRF